MIHAPVVRGRILLAACSLGFAACSPPAGPADPPAAEAPRAAPAAPAEAKTEKSAWVVERLDWHSHLQHGRTVEVRNDYGNVDIRRLAGTDATVVVQAFAQRRRDDAADESIKVSELADRTLIEIVLPNPMPSRAGPKRRVDTGVALSADRLLLVHTLDGDISTKSTPGLTNARTGSGKISAVVQAPSSLRSDRGDVSARVECAGGQHTTRVESGAGKLELFVGAGCAGRVEVEAAARLDSAYTLDASQGSDSKPRRVRLGDSPEVIRLAAPHGRVRIEKPPHWAQACKAGDASCANGVTAQTVEPGIYSGKLSDLPPAQAWKPGDPVRPASGKTKGKTR